MIYQYIRYSTNQQDEESQNNIILTYCQNKDIRIDKTIRDEGISGGVNYKERNLNELLHELRRGDTLIISEISRLTRGGIIELSELIQTFFKPNNLRLIICNVNLDIDCTDINPMVEMQLMMLATFAKIEKQLIQERTTAGLNAIRKEIAENGFHIAKKSGRRITSLGGNKTFSEKARTASAESRRKAALSNVNNKLFVEFINDYQLIHGKLTANSDFGLVADELNRRGKLTATGLPYNKLRARSMFYNTKELFINQK
jgi:DNA invertase Pin-like site-specific DNA recombinase